MKLLATKVYRPDTVSVADWTVDATPEELGQWWRWGSGLKIEGNSEADHLRNRAALRRAEGLIITAHKRRGHIVLKAHVA